MGKFAVFSSNKNLTELNCGLSGSYEKEKIDIYFIDVGCTEQSTVKGPMTSIHQEQKLLSHLLVAT